MRYLWILFLPALCYGVTPIANDYGDAQNSYVEFRNVMDNAQDKSFTVVTTTPNYTDLRDGEIVVCVSTPFVTSVNLMLRAGTTLYASPMFPIIKGR